jgi:hypothetical protein
LPRSSSKISRGTPENSRGHLPVTMGQLGSARRPERRGGGLRTDSRNGLPTPGPAPPAGTRPLPTPAIHTDAPWLRPHGRSTVYPTPGMPGTSPARGGPCRPIPARLPLERQPSEPASWRPPRPRSPVNSLGRSKYRQSGKAAMRHITNGHNRIAMDAQWITYPPRCPFPAWLGAG